MVATPVHPELLLMLLADARLPTSGHTQSGGLEPALLGGLDPGDLDGYCMTRLQTVTLTEAATAVVCRSRGLAGRPTDARRRSGRRGRRRSAAGRGSG